MLNLVFFYQPLKGFSILKAQKNKPRSNLSYCGELVRCNDRDRFLQSMFFPADIREDLWVLFAFNHEIAKTREVVSDSNLGLIRLQWWRDEIKKIYDQGAVTDHEILKPLSTAIKKYNLPREHFDKLLYAREFDLEDVLPANLEGLMNYADFTTQPLFRLALIITGADSDLEVVQPIAVNYALAGILRSTGYFSRQNRFLLPEDLMNKYSITKESFFDEENSESLKPIVKEIVESRLAILNSDSIFLKSAQAISGIYFKQIESLDYDVLSSAIKREPSLKVFRVFWKTKIL